MATPEVFNQLRPWIEKTLKDPELSRSQLSISCRVLTPQEAIGSPERNDFPLQKGKEKLMQAEIDGSFGQAFSDMPGSFQGTLEGALTLPPDNNYHRAVIIAALNAVGGKLGLTSHTIHCKDQAPQKCSLGLVEKISSEYGRPRIAFFGLQPAMVEELAKHFEIRVFDLDPENIGQVKFGVTIESGECDLEEVETWGDLFLVTGSTVVNGTIDCFLKVKKPVIFYGTTVAAAAEIIGLKRFCSESL